MTPIKYWDSLQNLAEHTAYVEPRLRRKISSPAGINILWVLVEGEADMYFYERMFVGPRAKVVKAGRIDRAGNVKGGIHAVKEIVGHILTLGITQFIIGVIDRDWRIYKKNAKQPLPQNIFETDYRDLEMTLMALPRVRRLLKTEIVNTMNSNHLKFLKDGDSYKQNGDWYEDVWQRCCLVSRYMGIFHIIASRYGWNRVCFSSNDYWDEHRHCLYSDWSGRLFRLVMRQCSVSQCKLKFYKYRFRFHNYFHGYSLYDECRGHDFLSVLSSMLIDSRHYSEKWMTYYMAKEVSVGEIQSMRLYKSIGRWQAIKKLTVLV